MVFGSVNQSTDNEKMILRKLRVWIAALAAVCVLGGISIGAILAGRNAVAQNGSQLSRAPEALSASFVEIARSVEPAVGNIDTMQTADLETDNEDRTDCPRNRADRFPRPPHRPTPEAGGQLSIVPKGSLLQTKP